MGGSPMAAEAEALGRRTVCGTVYTVYEEPEGWRALRETVADAVMSAYAAEQLDDV